MTRRERMERRLEKRREWADGRRAKADGLRKVDEHVRHDWAFITQPGHIPARARMNARDERAHEHGKVADHHERKADGLARVLDGPTIFSDDDDAPEALRARIAELEAKRERMKVLNAAFRKGDAAFAVALGVTVEQAAATRARIVDPANLSWHRVPHAAYELQNLGGNISRLKKRVIEVENRRTNAQAAEAAGGVIVTHTGDWSRVTFAEYPGREAVNELKAAGYRWCSGCWIGPTRDLPAHYAAEAAS